MQPSLFLEPAGGECTLPLCSCFYSKCLCCSMVVLLKKGSMPGNALAVAVLTAVLTLGEKLYMPTCIENSLSALCVRGTLMNPH